MKRLVLPLLFAMCLSGCASDLFYFPTNILYSRPEELGLKYEEIELTSEDETKLAGWYFPNKINPSAPRGTIVFFHGNAQNMTIHYLSLVWLVQYGYDLFIFDYRGYGASDGRSSQGGTVRDGRAALRWMQKRREERNIRSPNIVFGQSLGGAIAARSLGELKAKGEKIDADVLVLDSTFHSYQAIGYKVLNRSPSTLFSLLSPIAYLMVTDKWAPYPYYKYLGGIKKLVVHGDQDRVVPFELGETVYDKLPEPKTFWKIESGEHVDLFANHQNKYREQFLEFLK